MKRQLVKMPNCSVSCCKKRSGLTNVKKNGVTFHKFPKDPNIRDIWKKFCNNRRTWMPTSKSVLCSDHFKASDFKTLRNNTRGLIDRTTPTLLPNCDCAFHPLLHSVADDGLPRVSISVPEWFTSPATLQHDDASASATQNLVVPLASDIIYNVYHYLLNEYKNMKQTFAGTGCDLSPLADILTRTAEATGANQDAVITILKRRKRSRGRKLDTAAGKRPKLADNFVDDDVSPTEEDSSNEGEEDDELAVDDNGANDDGQTKPMEPITVKIEIEQTQQTDPLIATLKVEIDEEHENHSEAAKELISREYFKPALSQSNTAVQYFSSVSVSPTHKEVKLESPDEDLQSTNQTDRCMNLAKDVMSDPLGADTPSHPPTH